MGFHDNSFAEFAKCAVTRPFFKKIQIKQNQEQNVEQRET